MRFSSCGSTKVACEEAKLPVRGPTGPINDNFPTENFKIKPLSALQTGIVKEFLNAT